MHLKFLCFTDWHAKGHIGHWRTPETSFCILSAATAATAATTEKLDEQRQVSGATVGSRGRRRLSTLVQLGSVRIPTAAAASATATLVTAAADLSG